MSALIIEKKLVKNVKQNTLAYSNDWCCKLASDVSSEYKQKHVNPKPRKKASTFFAKQTRQPSLNSDAGN
jgi:hypothetical protein